MNIIRTKEQLEKGMDTYTFVDVRTRGNGTKTGMEAYELGHLPGAVFLDVKEDLSGKDVFLPEPQHLAQTLGKLGMDAEAKIVLYDEGSQRAASKAWFVLHYLGHEHVYILQGGFSSWQESGGNIVQEVQQVSPVTYEVKLRTEVAVTLAEVKAQMAEGGTQLIDSRAPDRYTGRKEPKYAKAGHIPGALNYHAKEVLEESGAWKASELLQDHFAGLDQAEEVIVSCGSGNSACMNLVALKEAGYENVKLFAGGFSEWITDDINEVITGDLAEFDNK